MSFEQAIKRPLNYFSLDERERWAVDKRLGILDWSPKVPELRKYLIKRAEMGDPYAMKWEAKARNGDPI